MKEDPPTCRGVRSISRRNFHWGHNRLRPWSRADTPENDSVLRSLGHRIADGGHRFRYCEFASLPYPQKVRISPVPAVSSRCVAPLPRIASTPDLLTDGRLLTAHSPLIPLNCDERVLIDRKSQTNRIKELRPSLSRSPQIGPSARGEPARGVLTGSNISFCLVVASKQRQVVGQRHRLDIKNAPTNPLPFMRS